MRVSVRGWGRDHGEKEVLDAEVTDLPLSDEDTFYRGNTYLKIKRRLNPHPSAKGKLMPPTAHVWAGAKLNLSGSYLVQVELSHTEIARLFFLTNGDRELGDILEQFASFKGDQTQDSVA